MFVCGAIFVSCVVLRVLPQQLNLFPVAWCVEGHSNVSLSFFREQGLPLWRFALDTVAVECFAYRRPMNRDANPFQLFLQAFSCHARVIYLFICWYTFGVILAGRPLLWRVAAILYHLFIDNLANCGLINI